MIDFDLMLDDTLVEPIEITEISSPFLSETWVPTLDSDMQEEMILEEMRQLEYAEDDLEEDWYWDHYKDRHAAEVYSRGALDEWRKNEGMLLREMKAEHLGNEYAGFTRGYTRHDGVYVDGYWKGVIE